MRFLAAAGLVMLLSGVGSYYATDQRSIFSIANLALGPVLLLLAAAGEIRRLRGFSGRRSQRVLLRWLAIGAAVVAGVVVASWLGTDSGQLDLTRERGYTLSEQTLGVCARLAQAGQAGQTAPGSLRLVLLDDAKLARDVALLLDTYRTSCPAVSVRRVSSADAAPEVVRVLTQFETTVVACRDDKCEPTGFPSEGNLTNALLRLSRDDSPLVYFVTGHGEANFADPGPHGFSSLAGALRDEGIRVRVHVGPASERIPDDAGAVILAGPTRDLLPGEIAALESYLAGGGRLLVLLEPAGAANVVALLEGWGFGLPDGVIADPRGSPLLEEPSLITLIANAFNGSHPVTRGLDPRTMIALPGARPVLPLRKPEPDDRLHGLVWSSSRSWVEQDLGAALEGREIRPDPGELGGQEIPLAAAGRYPRGERETRIVVIGDQEFASNRLIGALYNHDLLMNALLWLTENEDQISQRPKFWQPDQDPLTLSQTLSYFYFAAFALPEALLLLGIHAWYRQRG